MTLINFQQHLNTTIHLYACFRMSDMCVCIFTSKCTCRH